MAPAIPDGANPVLPGMGFPVGDFMAMHVSVIPKGPHQGHLMVWDGFSYSGAAAGQIRVHRWGIVDPVNKLFWNFNMLLPQGKGDLFCAGHAWTAEGDLLVVGGTGCHGNGNGPCGNSYEGSKLAYLWQPPTVYGGGGVWQPIQPDLDDLRWYPSGLSFDTDPNNAIMDPVGVVGGTHLGTPVDSYQQWLPVGPVPWKRHPTNFTNRFLGPGGAAALSDYPRVHWVSSLEHMATAGMYQASSRVNPHSSTLAETWSSAWNQATHHVYGSSVLYPISPGGVPFKDLVLSIGGKSDGNPLSGTILAAVELCNAGASSPAWSPFAPLTHARWFLNTVVMPDSSVLVVGGETYYRGWSCSEVPALVPELYIYGAWAQMAAATIVRDYHSAAVLLPSGKVILSGGESRHYGGVGQGNCANPRTRLPGPADYDIFVPHYIQCGWTRPSIRNQAAAGGFWTWNRSGMYDVEYDTLPPGLSIAKAVLIRPGSVTHHSDGNQRCVELPLTHNTPPLEGYPSVKVTVPSASSNLLPRGIYMLFLVTNQGAPSPAAWVKVTA